MNKNKQHQYDKLQKSSIIFTQLGLVLALLIVYSALEFSAQKKVAILEIPDIEYDPTPVFDIDIIDIERAVTPEEPKKVKKKVRIIDPEIVPNDTDLLAKILPPDDKTPAPDFDAIIEIIEPVNTPPVPFIKVEEAPIFPGCEGLDSIEAKICFSKKISKFVNKKFNTNLANGLNISGKQRIFVKFIIDDTGQVVDVKARSPYKGLEKEAERVVKELPKMIPGKQRTRAVKVTYTLPIIFAVQ